jgi:hypothetical protein
MNMVLNPDESHDTLKFHSRSPTRHWQTSQLLRKPFIEYILVFFKVPS